MVDQKEPTRYERRISVINKIRVLRESWSLGEDTSPLTRSKSPYPRPCSDRSGKRSDYAPWHGSAVWDEKLWGSPTVLAFHAFLKLRPLV
jgi:hypothetical protein